jgi:palmitoyl-protein thioesterase
MRFVLLCTFLFGTLVNINEGLMLPERTPIVMWHGMGDSCCNPFSMGSVKRYLESKLPGVYVLSLMIGNNVIQDTENGFVMQVPDQIDLACSIVKNDSRLANGFHAVGFSQGGLFIRGLVQECGDQIPVRSLVSIGGPQQGVYGVPHCLGEDHTLCDYMRRLLNYGAYTSWVQDILVQAQYWHDPLAEEEYSNKSIFLAKYNNQGPDKNAAYKENLMKVEKFLLVKFSKDTMVDPKGSEWFSWFSPTDSSKIVPYNETALYTEDWIGLKTLDEGKRLHFMAVDGNHLQLDNKSLDYIIDNYLH